MPCTSDSMSFGFGLDSIHMVPKQKFRWLFKISGVSASDTGVTRSLPPRRSARPNFSWKEQEVQHLSETIYLPLKPQWEPVELVLYDICTNCCNPVFIWLATAQANQSNGGPYNPQAGTLIPILDSNFKRQGDLYLYDGCGTELEHWVFENCYPSHIKWGDLDMDSSDIITVEATIRYDRAYCIPCPSAQNDPQPPNYYQPKIPKVDMSPPSGTMNPVTGGTGRGIFGIL